MKRIRIIGVVVALVACLFAGIKISGAYLFKTKESDAISRFDWIEMLDESMGFDFQENNSPSIFGDVSEDDPHYGAVKTAEQYGVLVEGGTFNGEEALDREFVAKTTMRAIGKDKISFVENIDGDLTDEKCNELAKKYNLLKDIGNYVSKEEAEKILSNAKDLSNTTFWPNEYEKVVLADNVINSDDSSYPLIGKGDTYVTVPDELYKNAETGNVILLKDDCSGIVYAKRVVSKDGSNVLKIEDVMDMGEVADSIKISKKVSVTMDDILASYGLSQNSGVSTGEANGLITNASSGIQNKKTNKEFEGFRIEVESDDDKLKIALVNNADSTKIELPEISAWDSKRASFKSSLDVKDITLGVQYEGDLFDGVKLCNLSIESTVNQDVIIQPLNSEGNDTITKSFPLAEMEIPLGWLPLNLKLSLNLEVSVTGNIELKATMKSYAEAGYSKGRGIYASATIKDKDYGIDVSAQANAGLVGMPALYFSGLKNLMDVDLYAGAEADADMKLYKSGSCLTIDLYAPLVRFDVCADTEHPSLLRELCGKDDDDSDPLYSKEIISKEKAEHTGLYYQKKTGEKGEFVDACTIGVGEQEIKQVVWTKEPSMDQYSIYYVYAKGDCREYIGDICPRSGDSNETMGLNTETHEYVHESFPGGVVVVEKDGKWGFLDYDGEVRMEPVVPSLTSTDLPSSYTITPDCPFVVLFGGCFQYPGGLGEHKEKLVSPDYRTVTDYVLDGVGSGIGSPVMCNGKLYMMLGYDYEYTPFGKNPRMVVKELAENKMGADVIGLCVIDENGSLISRFPSNTNGRIFSEAGDFYNGYYIAGISGQQCLVNADTGKAVNDKIYEAVRPYNNGYAPVKRNDLWTFIDGDGNEVCEPIFEDATPLYEGKTYVKIDGKYGILNLQETIDQGIEINAETCGQ